MRMLPRFLPRDTPPVACEFLSCGRVAEMTSAAGPTCGSAVVAPEHAAAIRAKEVIVISRPSLHGHGEHQGLHPLLGPWLETARGAERFRR